MGGIIPAIKGINSHRRLTWFLPFVLALIVAGVMIWCVVRVGYRVQATRDDARAYGFASPEHGARHAYHGILYSYWDDKRQRWSFERDGRVCRL